MQLLPQKYLENLSSTEITKVKKILNPQISEIKEGTLMIAYDTTYGVVLAVKNDPYYQIKIGWYNRKDHLTIEDETWYTEETMKGCSVKLLPMVLPGEIFVIIPKGISVLLEDDSIYTFEITAFFIAAATETHYVAVSREQQWLFPIENFPGIPERCLVEKRIQKALSAAKQESLLQAFQKEEIDLLWKIQVWLSNEIPCLINEKNLDYEEIKSKCNEVFKHPHFEEIFNKQWNDYLDNLKKNIGLQFTLSDDIAFKQGDRLIWSKINPSAKRGCDYGFGTLKTININPISILIDWDSDCSLPTEYNGLAELYSTGIQKLFFYNFNKHIVVEYSQSYNYFNAAFGFSSQKIAKSWLRPIKAKIGYLSHLQTNLRGFAFLDTVVFIDELDRLYDHRQFYVIDKPKHKTFKGFSQNLNKIAELDFSQFNSK